jgi:hypothetical protein
MNRTNPYEKYLSKEQVMQSEIVRLLSIKYPDLFWWHTHNEGDKSPFEQYVFKKMGGLSGVSDFILLEESNFSKGMMLEIKYGVNACTHNQVDFLITSAKKGYTAVVVYNDSIEAMKLIDRHMQSGTGYLPGDGIILIKNGTETVIPFEEAIKVLCKRSKEKAVKDKVKKLFQNNGSKKFGSPLKEKLFKSLNKV